MTIRIQYITAAGTIWRAAGVVSLVSIRFKPEFVNLTRAKIEPVDVEEICKFGNQLVGLVNTWWQLCH